MKEVQDIKDQAGAFSGRYGPAVIVQGKVTAVNANDTIDVELLNGRQIPDVLLRATTKDGSKYVEVPADGSVVMVGSINNSDEYVLLKADEVQSVTAVINGVFYQADADGFLIKKDEDTALQVFNLIIEAVMQVVVLEGNNPDYAKLQEAKTKAQNIFK